MGSNSQQPPNTGTLVKGRSKSPNQSVGAKDCPSSSITLPVANPRTTYHCKNGQHVCESLSEQPGWLMVVSPPQNSNQTTVLGCSSSLHQSRTHPGLSQHSGRLAEQTDHPTRGMVLEQSTVSKDSRALWTARGGSACLPSQLSSTKVLHQVLPSGSRSIRRPDLHVAKGAALRIPANSVAAKDPLHQVSESRRSSSGAQVASTVVVFNDTTDVISAPTGATCQPGPAGTGANLASTPRAATSDRLEIEMGFLLNMGYSTEVINTILASRKDSAIRIYNVTWKAFHRWCLRKSVDAIHPSIPVVLNFL